MNKPTQLPFFLKKEGKAFTLIETLVVITIFGLIMGALFTLIPFLYRIDTYVWHQAHAINEARRGVKVMIREIREAQTGEDGSYVIEKAGDSEFIFFSDINQDNKVERVRYFLGGISSREEVKECVSHIDGGSCSVIFSNFYNGVLKQAHVRVSIEGDFSWTREYAEIFVDGFKLGELCKGFGECNDCPGFWQGTATFDVTDQSKDNFIQFTADSSVRVNNFCNWQEPNHSIKAKFVLLWTEVIPGQEMKLKKGVIEATGNPPTYSGEEKITILSAHVHNKTGDPPKPIFRYFDANGEEIIENPARPEETRLMQVFLIINVRPGRAPDDFTLKSKVQLRNLRLREN